MADGAEWLILDFYDTYCSTKNFLMSDQALQRVIKRSKLSQSVFWAKIGYFCANFDLKIGTTLNTSACT